jgi:hypothetical protein
MGTTVNELVIYDAFNPGPTTLHSTLEDAQQRVRETLIERHGFDTVCDQEAEAGFDSLRTLSNFTIGKNSLS